jgi:glycosyltransferase involved in cell wall biosynthesis
LRMMFDPPRRVHSKLHVITLPQIPFRHLPGVGAVNRWLGCWLVRRAIRRLGFQKVLSWFVVPHAGGVAGALGEPLIVYYCIDDYGAFPGVDPVAIRAMDDSLTRRADVVFVAPPALVESKRALNPNTHFSPHGVDVDLFAKASDPETPAAAETENLSRPVVGYFGTLGEWLDYDLLVWLARQRPKWTFLYVGYAAADVMELRGCPNVTLVGPKPYETLPRWAKAFDVAIIPYRLTQQVINANPLKMREYLASGKPVVSITCPETARFAKQLYLADGREAYLDAIERAMAENSPERSRERMASVRQASWDARFRETVEIVERMLAGKESQGI